MSPDRSAAHALALACRRFTEGGSKDQQLDEERRRDIVKKMATLLLEFGLLDTAATVGSTLSEFSFENILGVGATIHDAYKGQVRIGRVVQDLDTHWLVDWGPNQTKIRKDRVGNKPKRQGPWWPISEEV